MKNTLNETGLILEMDLEDSSCSGVLSGLKVAVKDLFHIKGFPTSAGNPDWLATHEIPEATSSAVGKLIKAGARVVGKSLTDELAYSLNGVNVHFGTPINHSAPNRLPGGSTSGSAVAVSGGVADIGLGTDTGGSIRVPASYNGLFGLRPTHGLIAMDNMVPLAPSFDTVGWLTRDIETLEKAADVLLPLENRETEYEIKRLVVLKPVIADKTIWNTDMDDWIDNIRVQFDTLEEIEFAPSFYADASDAFRTLQGAEIWKVHGDWIEKEHPAFAPDIQARFEWCKSLTEDDIARAKELRKRINLQLENVFSEPGTAILLPTTPGAAPLLEASPDFMDEYRIQLMGLTALAGLSGRPQLHLPVLSDRKAPWGMSLIGAKGTDLKLVECAKKLLRNNK